MAIFTKLIVVNLVLLITNTKRHKNENNKLGKTLPYLREQNLLLEN